MNLVAHCTVLVPSGLTVLCFFWGYFLGLKDTQEQNFIHFFGKNLERNRVNVMRRFFGEKKNIAEESRKGAWL